LCYWLDIFTNRQYYYIAYKVIPVLYFGVSLQRHGGIMKVYFILIVSLSILFTFGCVGGGKTQHIITPTSQTLAKQGQTQPTLTQQRQVAPPQEVDIPPAPLHWIGDGGKGIRLAVLEPTSSGLSAQELWMLSLIQSSITGDFNKYSDMTLIDRQNLEKILAEQSQSLSGNYSDNDYIRIGQLTNSRYILAGSISKTYPSKQPLLPLNNGLN
jgi:hypothetical protein